MISNNMNDKKQRGRPAKEESEKKQKFGTKLAPDVNTHIRKQPNMSAYIEKVVRKDMESDDE